MKTPPRGHWRGLHQQRPHHGDATTLYDTVGDRVSLQPSANAGTLAPTGNLGVDASPSAGSDISDKASNGSNQGFAALPNRR
ncbi:DUF4394 domain-containing protein [Streptomyces sp. NPDC046324]|uniref:DUF4394 domain-containing protein n=1 Tax=Streptomyces sp. NPDC046324 TaxID=3154915 RepID=UPI0034060A2D